MLWATDETTRRTRRTLERELGEMARLGGSERLSDSNDAGPSPCMGGRGRTEHPRAGGAPAPQQADCARCCPPAAPPWWAVVFARAAALFGVWTLRAPTHRRSWSRPPARAAQPPTPFGAALRGSLWRTGKAACASAANGRARCVPPKATKPRPWPRGAPRNPDPNPGTHLLVGRGFLIIVRLAQRERREGGAGRSHLGLCHGRAVCGSRAGGSQEVPKRWRGVVACCC